MGSLKPGLARRWVLSYILWVIEWTRATLYTKGRLARVRTIHFARWVFLDGKKRILFASNYDGSLDSYMDDFINKVGFGLNVVFCNGIGYPHDALAACRRGLGRAEVQIFSAPPSTADRGLVQRAPGMTAIELERNSRIRQGLEAAALSEEAAREWVGSAVR